MNEDGYTLVEMLAALAIIGLAMAGLAESARALRLLQQGVLRSVQAQQAGERAGRDLQRLFASQGPFRSKNAAGLSGGRAKLEFPCAGGGSCGARLTTNGGTARLELAGDGWRDVLALPASSASFVYVDAEGGAQDWPPSTSAPPTLVALAVIATRGAQPIAQVRLWRDEAFDCQFDPIAVDCREAAK
jgi:prepilin-type N-terminal cleavage/methylation domain-containing protein